MIAITVDHKSKVGIDLLIECHGKDPFSEKPSFGLQRQSFSETTKLVITSQPAPGSYNHYRICAGVTATGDDSLLYVLTMLESTPIPKLLAKWLYERVKVRLKRKTCLETQAVALSMLAQIIANKPHLLDERRTRIAGAMLMTRELKS